MLLVRLFRLSRLQTSIYGRGLEITRVKYTYHQPPVRPSDPAFLKKGQFSHRCMKSVPIAHTWRSLRSFPRRVLAARPFIAGTLKQRYTRWEPFTTHYPILPFQAVPQVQWDLACRHRRDRLSVLVLHGYCRPTKGVWYQHRFLFTRREDINSPWVLAGHARLSRLFQLKNKTADKDSGH